MKLGIIGAMQVEIQTLLDYMKDEIGTEKGGCTYFEGTLDGVDVVVALCGVGKVNAAICTQIMLSDYGVTHLVNTGVAGSLDASLNICDMVISTDAMYHDVDVRQFGYAFGQVPGSKVVAYPADPMLAEMAYRAADAVHPGHTRYGRIASGDQFISSVEKKNEIIRNTQGCCAEMEGAAIAQTAYSNQIPFVIIRSISDKADGSDIMDYPTFENISAIRCAEVTRKLAEILHAEQGD